MRILPILGGSGISNTQNRFPLPGFSFSVILMLVRDDLSGGAAGAFSRTYRGQGTCLAGSYEADGG